MRGGKRQGAGRPKKPDHLKKIYKVHSFSAGSIGLINTFAKKHKVPLSWVVDAAIQLLNGKMNQKTLARLLKEKD